MKIYSFVFLCFFSFSILLAQEDEGIVFTDGTFNELLTKAKAEDKLVFVDAFTTWCGPCKWLEANVFTDATVGAYFNEQFVNSRFDMEKGEGLELAKRYNVRAYPTLLFVDGDGEVVHRICGSMPAEKFLEASKEVFNLTGNIGYYLSEYEKGNRESAFLANYFLALSDACMETSGMDEYWETQNQSDYLKEHNCKLIQQFANDVDSEQFKYVSAHKDQFVEAYGTEDVDRFINRTFEQFLLRTAYSGTEEDYKAAKETVAASNYDGKEELMLRGDLVQAMGLGNWASLVEIGDTYVEKFGSEREGFINSISWALYEEVNDKEQLTAAANWMASVVESSPLYAYVDTYAALLLKSGNLEEGEKWAKKAIEIAEKDGEDASGTQELLEEYKPGS